MKSAQWLLAAAALAVIPLASQSPLASTPQPDDPPARVGRLNWLTGDVAFQPAGLDEWTTATVNYPLTTADHLYTGQDSRAEIHVGPNAIRLNSNTNFGFLNVDDGIVQVSITEGSMEIRLRTLDDDDSFEIATPNGAITLLRTGDYRIDTDPERDATMLTVRAGQAELFSGANSVIIRSPLTAYFKTDQNPNVQSANDPDDFDSFVAAREGTVLTTDAAAAAGTGGGRAMDRFSDRVTVADLEAEGMTGAEDLNAYGTWQSTPAGQDWVPPVDPGWQPYSDGDWAYVEPWGWTWIDAAPWGFAPYHYGRWGLVNGRWVWYPGGRQTVQVYAPALVTFISGGPAGTVSWFPLGPRDIWLPPWRPQPDSAILARLSSNRNAPGAIRTLSSSDFISGAEVHPTVGLSSEGDIAGSSPLVMPTRDSLLVGTVRTRPTVVNRPLIARTAPPPAPVSFAATLGLLAVNRGRPLQPKQVEYLRKTLPAAVVQRVAVRSTVPLINTPRTPKPAAPARPQVKPASVK